MVFVAELVCCIGIACSCVMLAAFLGPLIDNIPSADNVDFTSNGSTSWNEQNVTYLLRRKKFVCVFCCIFADKHCTIILGKVITARNEVGAR